MEQNTINHKKSVSFRFSHDVKNSLSKLSETTGRSQTFLAEEAISQYCDIQNWQVSAIKSGLKDANNGRLVSHDDVKKKWVAKRDNCLD